MGTLSAIEYRGGPWDGDYRGWDETKSVVSILLDDMRVIGKHNQPKLDECPRIGRYAFVCGLGGDKYYEWMGER